MFGDFGTRAGETADIFDGTASGWHNNTSGAGAVTRYMNTKCFSWDEEIQAFKMPDNDEYLTKYCNMVSDSLESLNLRCDLPTGYGPQLSSESCKNACSLYKNEDYPNLTCRSYWSTKGGAVEGSTILDEDKGECVLFRRRPEDYHCYNNYNELTLTR